MTQTHVKEPHEIVATIMQSLDDGDDTLMAVNEYQLEVVDALFRYLDFQIIIIRGFPGEMISGSWGMMASAYRSVSVDQVMEMRSMTGEREDSSTPGKDSQTVEERIASLDKARRTDTRAGDDDEEEVVDGEQAELGDDE